VVGADERQRRYLVAIYHLADTVRRGELRELWTPPARPDPYSGSLFHCYDVRLSRKKRARYFVTRRVDLELG